MTIQKIDEKYYKILAAPLESKKRQFTCYPIDCKPHEVYKNVRCKTRQELTRRSANTNVENNYYSSLSEYRQSRCKTYKQSQYHYGITPSGKSTSNCGSDISGCNVKYYKPLNEKFSTNSAVSAGSRIQRLKYNSITTSASLSPNSIRYHQSIYKQQPFLNNVNPPCECTTPNVPVAPKTEQIREFTLVGTVNWVAPVDVTSVEYLVVGGGGGGGGAYDTGAGGGGGAGTVRTGTLSVSPSTTYTITIGTGGTGGIGEANGSNGTQSVFASIVSPGGSGGYRSREAPDGIGVGGAQATLISGGGGGNGGGHSGTSIGAGGGGGAGGPGTTSTARVVAPGGIGISTSITGSFITYGRGGSSGLENHLANGVSASANTGSGGQGASSASSSNRNGGNGGSGIVVIKYSTSYP